VERSYLFKLAANFPFHNQTDQALHFFVFFVSAECHCMQLVAAVIYFVEVKALTLKLKTQESDKN